jgi:hypothetical protein
MGPTLLVTRQADSLEGGHGSGGVRKRLPDTQCAPIGKGGSLLSAGRGALTQAKRCGFESRLSANKTPPRVHPHVWNRR